MAAEQHDTRQSVTGKRTTNRVNSFVGTKTKTSNLLNWWTVRRTMLLRIAVGLMAVAAVVWLGYEFWRLLGEPAHIGPWKVHLGAIDLKMRYQEVHKWFAGEPVYRELKDAVYPPASYAILWPLLGWLKLTAAKWLWAVTTVASLAWLVYLIVLESGADTPLGRVFVALIPLSMYPTGAAIGNGQLIVHLMPMLLAGLLMLSRGQGRWDTDLVSGLLIVICLVKPSITTPFLWIVLLVPGRLRPFCLVFFGYVTLTLFSASFQETGLVSLFRDWLANSSDVAVNAGHANLHRLLAHLGLRQWIFPTSLLVQLSLGIWIYYHRHGDLWTLVGVTALVARFWTYHRWYDDLLILLPMVALYRISKNGPSIRGIDMLAGILLALTMAFMVAPGGLYLLRLPWNTIYVSVQTVLWVIVLVFLLKLARYKDVVGWKRLQER